MKIIIYSTPTCAYCKLCKQWFDEKNIKYKEIDLSIDIKTRDLIIEKTGMMSVPIIQIGEEFILGFNKHRVEKLLDM